MLVGNVVSCCSFIEHWLFIYKSIYVKKRGRRETPTVCVVLLPGTICRDSLFLCFGLCISVFLGFLHFFFCHHPLNLVFLSCYEDESNGGKNQASVILFCTQFTFARLLGDQEGARKQKLGSKRVGDKNEGRDWLGRQERSVVLQQYDLM